jgi:hypothetical protein
MPRKLPFNQKNNILQYNSWKLHWEKHSLKLNQLKICNMPVIDIHGSLFMFRINSHLHLASSLIACARLIHQQLWTTFILWNRSGSTSWSLMIISVSQILLRCTLSTTHCALIYRFIGSCSLSWHTHLILFKLSV